MKTLTFLSQQIDANDWERDYWIDEGRSDVAPVVGIHEKMEMRNPVSIMQGEHVATFLK